MGVQIVYTSRTGNTEKLAEAVFAAVPVKEKNVKRIEERTERDDGEMYLVGSATEAACPARSRPPPRPDPRSRR